MKRSLQEDTITKFKSLFIKKEKSPKLQLHGRKNNSKSEKNLKFEKTIHDLKNLVKE